MTLEAEAQPWFGLFCLLV